MIEQPKFEILPCGHRVQTASPQGVLEDLKRIYGIDATSELDAALKAEFARHSSGECRSDEGDVSIQSRPNAEGEREFWLVKDGKDVQKLASSPMTLAAQENLIDSLRKSTGVSAREAMDVLGVIDPKLRGKTE